MTDQPEPSGWLARIVFTVREIAAVYGDTARLGIAVWRNAKGPAVRDGGSSRSKAQSE